MVFLQSPVFYPRVPFARSSNYFNKEWSGFRRVKNVVFSLEWLPDLAISATDTDVDPRTLDSPALQKIFACLEDDAHIDKTALAELLSFAFNFDASLQDAEMALALMSRIQGECYTRLCYQSLLKLLSLGHFRQRDNRYERA